MATTERPAHRVNRGGVAQIVLGLLVLVIVVAVIVALRQPPQMGADEEVFRTVDALFTAVTARDEKRLGDCEQRLHGYRDAGRLPADAAGFLDGIIAKTRRGDWESAAERLYDFMLAQCREGTREPAAPKHDIKAKRK